MGVGVLLVSKKKIISWDVGRMILPPSLRGNFCNTKFVYDFVIFSFECHLMYQWQFSFNVCLLCFCPQTELACVDNFLLFHEMLAWSHESLTYVTCKRIFFNISYNVKIHSHNTISRRHRFSSAQSSLRALWQRTCSLRIKGKGIAILWLI